MRSGTREWYFVYKCSTNDGLETWVPADRLDRAELYDERDCETLDRISGVIP